MLIGPRCFADMADISHYRERANHLRQLAGRTWQDDLEALLRRVAHDYDQVAEQGVRPELISARGFGDTDAVASNDTPQGRAQNRRVELSSGCCDFRLNRRWRPPPRRAVQVTSPRSLMDLERGSRSLCATSTAFGAPDHCRVAIHSFPTPEANCR
jgi:hypothetical protein